jgi:hypothetical protein
VHLFGHRVHGAAGIGLDAAYVVQQSQPELDLPDVDVCLVEVGAKRVAIRRTESPLQTTREFGRVPKEQATESLTAPVVTPVDVDRSDTHE